MTERRPTGKAKDQAAPLTLTLQDRTLKGVVWQVVVVLVVVLLAGYLYSNTVHNLATRDIKTGYDFLAREAGFPIGEALIAYTPADSYARALLVGLLNTLHVALIGLVLATLLGVCVGVGTLSQNALLASLMSGYIHLLRNIPVLLQIVLWYSIFISDRFLPHPRQAEPFFGIYLTQRGIYFPVPEWNEGFLAAIVAFGLAMIASMVIARRIDQHRRTTGKTLPAGWLTAGLLIGLPILAWAASGVPTNMLTPVLKGFNVVGGSRITPEFVAVLVGLTIYTSAFIGEIVRAGILAVPRGQIEAARALGLREGVILRKITLPQAMRVIVPPLTSQYLNLMKNSSLAVAVGYPDLVSVTNSTINITGQAIEGVSIIMIVYLSMSLVTAIIMNWYNARVRLVER